MTLPADLANRALDALGANFVIGDIEEGGKVAEIIRRAYVPCRQQLLRTARWAFARRQADLFLLADRFGNVPGKPREVIWPWRFEYQYPIDCLQVRFVPQNHRPVENPLQGLTPGGGFTGAAPFVNETVGASYVRPGINTIGSASNRGHIQLRPGRFLVAVDPNYPGLVGSITDWSQDPDLQTVIGVGYTARTVILTDIHHAQAVYTADIEYPDEWDALFQEAFVHLLASKIALSVIEALDMDKKFGVQMMTMCINTAKALIAQARVQDANEGITSTDSIPDWIHDRWRGGRGFGRGHGGGGDGDDGGGGGSGGGFGETTTPVVFGNGSTY